MKRSKFMTGCDCGEESDEGGNLNRGMPAITEADIIPKERLAGDVCRLDGRAPQNPPTNGFEMNCCKRLAIALLLAALSAAPAWAGFDEGKAAYRQKDYATALREWRPLAEQGDAAAQSNLGLMYENGQGVARDDAEAVRWYRLAAAQGDARAQLSLGSMYENGQSVARDYAEALRWYRLAAAQDYALAQVNVGVMYEKGQGVVQDYSEALKWYRLAASQGNASALNNLSASIDSSDGSKAAGNRGEVSAEMSSAEVAAGEALTREMAKPDNPLRALDAYLAAKKKP